MSELNGLRLVWDPNIDFVESLFSIGRGVKIKNGHVERWRKAFADLLTPMVENSILFKSDSVFSEGLEIFFLSFVFENGFASVRDFVEGFSKYPAEKFMKRTLENMCEIIEADLPVDSEALVEFIEANQDIPREDKWDVFQFVSNPGKSMENLLKIFELHQKQFEKAEKRVSDLAVSFERELKAAVRNREYDFTRRLTMKLLQKEKQNPILFAPSVFMGDNIIVWEDKATRWIIAGYDHLDTVVKSLDTEAESLGLLKTLADESRLRIIKLLFEREYRNAEIAESLDLTKATISHHMNILCFFGFVNARKEGNKIYYSTDKEILKKLFDEILGSIFKH